MTYKFQPNSVTVLTKTEITLVSQQEMLPYHREKPRTLACRVPGNGRWYLILVFVNSGNTQCKTEIFLLFIVRCHDPPCPPCSDNQVILTQTPLKKRPYTIDLLSKISVFPTNKYILSPSPH